MVVRPATPDDLSPLRDLAERTFRDTFADANAPTDLDAYVRDAFGAERVESEVADPTSRYLLAEDGGRLVGYAKLRWDRNDGVTGARPVEIERLYADRSVIGQGVGAALMLACLDAAEAGGHDTVWLGVWEENPRAIAFYERWGFETVGAHTFRLGDDDQRDLVMSRSVQAVGGLTASG